jgi:hypothetical protein
MGRTLAGVVGRACPVPNAIRRAPRQVPASSKKLTKGLRRRPNFHREPCSGRLGVGGSNPLAPTNQFKYLAGLSAVSSPGFGKRQFGKAVPTGGLFHFCAKQLCADLREIDEKASLWRRCGVRKIKAKRAALPHRSRRGPGGSRPASASGHSTWLQISIDSVSAMLPGYG